jgi:hypothetical protein
MGEAMGNNPVLPEFFPIFGLLLFAVMWGLAALVLYGIIRFGVKHGMRSYYASVSQAPGADRRSDSQ